MESQRDGKQKVHRNLLAPLLLKVGCEEVDAAHELHTGHVTFFPYVAFVPLTFLGAVTAQSDDMCFSSKPVSVLKTRRVADAPTSATS
jgi:hypothetical protein